MHLTYNLPIVLIVFLDYLWESIYFVRLIDYFGLVLWIAHSSNGLLPSQFSLEKTAAESIWCHTKKLRFLPVDRGRWLWLFLFTVTSICISVWKGNTEASRVVLPVCEKSWICAGEGQTVGSQPEAVTSFLHPWVGKWGYNDLWVSTVGVPRSLICWHSPMCIPTQLPFLLLPLPHSSVLFISLQNTPKTIFIPIPFSWSDFVGVT